MVVQVMFKVRLGALYLIDLLGGVLSLQECGQGFEKNHILVKVADDGSVEVRYPSGKTKKFFPKPGHFGMQVVTTKVDFVITVATIKLIISDPA